MLFEMQCSCGSHGVAIASWGVVACTDLCGEWRIRFALLCLYLLQWGGAVPHWTRRAPAAKIFFSNRVQVEDSLAAQAPPREAAVAPPRKKPALAVSAAASSDLQPLSNTCNTSDTAAAAKKSANGGRATGLLLLREEVAAARPAGDLGVPAASVDALFVCAARSSSVRGAAEQRGTEEQHPDKADPRA